jgi:ParB family chromosome partitioning protein
LIATGESRWRAARIAGLQTLPCIVVQEKPGESDLLADRIVENHVRSDLQPVEFAQAIARLKLLNGCTSSQLARELGLSPAAITRAESLLDLPEDVQQLVNSGELPQSSAYEISRLKTEAEQRAQAMEAIEQGLSRDATAKEVRQKLGRKKAGGKASRLTCQLDGIAYTVSCRQKITWERLLETLDTIREEAIKLKESGKDISILPKALAAR